MQVPPAWDLSGSLTAVAQGLAHSRGSHGPCQRSIYPVWAPPRREPVQQASEWMSSSSSQTPCFPSGWGGAWEGTCPRPHSQWPCLEAKPIFLEPSAATYRVFFHLGPQNTVGAQVWEWKECSPELTPWDCVTRSHLSTFFVPRMSLDSPWAPFLLWYFILSKSSGPVSSGSGGLVVGHRTAGPL